MPKAASIYAIDFGTTNSLLGAVVGGQAIPLIPLDPTARDATLFRTLMYFPDAKTVFFGAEAIREFVDRGMEGRLIRSVKKFLPLPSFTGTQIDNRVFKLEDLVATFLREMRERANHHFGCDTKSVLLGRPVKFSQDPGEDALAQSRLEAAAKTAGFRDIAFCPEPVAAAYEFQKTITEPKIIAVCDYGGGTSDYTVILLHPEGGPPPEVLSMGGVPIAGDALDGEVMRHGISPHFGSRVEYKAPFGSNVLTMPIALMQCICAPAEISLLRERDTFEFLKNVRSWSLNSGDRKKMDQLFSLLENQLGFDVFEEIERVKRMLSDQDSEHFVFERSGISIHEAITVKDFNDWTHARTEKILQALDQTVKDAGLKFHEIDFVYATGGTAKVRALRKGISDRFGMDRVRDSRAFHSVADGLVKKAQELT